VKDGDSIVLTKDLILCRNNRGNLAPRFVNADDKRLLALAERLIDVFTKKPAPTRGGIAEHTTALVSAGRDAKVGRGLVKLLLDRSEFGHSVDVDYAALRRDVLARAARVLKEETLRGVGKYRAAVTQAPWDEEAEKLGDTIDLYADLPENETLLAFRDVTAQQLLERYNVGLVQALLLRADSLRAEVASPDPARMRRLFRYLKFFRLLVRVTVVADGAAAGTADAEVPRRIRLAVDGPTSIFDQPRRYGLQLASFFPALCSLEQWQLDADVEWRGKTARLQLDQTAGLVSHYRHFGAYVPEEVQLFEQHFRKMVKHWTLTTHRPCLQIRGQDLAFPDLAFKDCEGRIVHLELFHRWHSGPLRDRLAALKTCPELPLIIGVDRALADAGDIAEQIGAAKALGQRAFLFRDYPSVAKTVACLDTVADELLKHG
jgi:predicted nuclease of restriction endonuclease-like RecB superfamily